MLSESCCTCASLLQDLDEIFDEKSEKPIDVRELECCGRVICPRCISNNPRFSSYCPFCQTSSNVQDLLSMSGGKSSDLPSSHGNATTEHRYTDTGGEKSDQAPDVLHYVDPEHDTMVSISLAYGVPLSALRKSNKIYTDHLLVARRTLLIPGEFYKGGISLRPTPVEGEEEAIRKNKIRKWMVVCKVADYNIALLYLGQTAYDLPRAIETYLQDDLWEKEHPLVTSAKRKKVPSSGWSKRSTP